MLQEVTSIRRDREEVDEDSIWSIPLQSLGTDADVAIASAAISDAWHRLQVETWLVSYLTYKTQDQTLPSHARQMVAWVSMNDQTFLPLGLW